MVVIKPYLEHIICSHLGDLNKVTPFVRAMPDEFKHDASIDTFEAYKRYIASKPWVKTNYLKLPKRKPNWV